MYRFIDNIKSKNKQLSSDESNRWEIVLDIIAPEIVKHITSFRECSNIQGCYRIV